MSKFDFSGWATKCNIRCADGRTILKDAFKSNDGQTVPMVWNHRHNDPLQVLGHALLENRDEGVYAYCTFNNSESGLAAKEAVRNKDITSLSIFANNLKQDKGNVTHGVIREVSLVLAGANPGAYIDSYMSHSEESEDEAIIYHSDEDLFEFSEEDEEEISHAEGETDMDTEKKSAEDLKSEEAMQDIVDTIDTMNDKQKKAMNTIVGIALELANADNSKEDTKEEKDDMKHNVFEQSEETNEEFLSHDELMTIIKDAKNKGSLKESFLAHAEDMDYGVENLTYLFPEDRNVTDKPMFISRDMGWVQKVMGSVHHTPFSRIKSMFADITEDQARAKGYIKGKLKKEEVFSLLKRRTGPTTIYKKQKMDRDDIIDITGFDVVAWIKAEMRLMLDEEIARAILIGDGRLSSDDDKIDENCVRPVVSDKDLFVIRYEFKANGTDDANAKEFERAAIKSRINYKGAGTPTLFTTEEWLTDMLLREDTIGHKIYKTESELATTLRVKEIVTVPPMEGLTTTIDATTYGVAGIIVNLYDYNVGADKGGSINMFEDFDIDYNQEKYLIETRCSGALTTPFSAIVLLAGTTTQSLEPTLDTAAKKAANIADN